MDEQSPDTPETDVIADILADTEDQPTVADPTPVEEAQEEVVETPADEEPESEAESEAEQPEEETEDLQPEVDPKEEARRRYEERQAAIEERRSRIEIAGQEYIKNGEDEYDQRLRAMEVDRKNEIVENNENKLINEFERAKANPDLQIYNPENREAFNEKAYAKALKDFNAGYIVYDEQGNITKVKGSLFEHLTETAELLRGAVQSGAVQQVRDSRKMRTSADPKPAAPRKEAQKDAILEALTSD
jgi:hypothetical protein